MSKEFTRESRYVVFKVEDASKALNVEELRTLNLLHAKVGLTRAIAGLPDRNYVVVSSSNADLYEATWRAIQLQFAQDNLRVPS